MWTDVLSKFDSGELLGILFMILVFGGGLLAALVAILATQWRMLRQTQLEVALKQDMVARGMAPGEIERVIRATAGAAPLPTPELTQATTTPTEVVVEYEGDWYPAIVLKSGPEQCYVHYMGYEASENEWVSKERIRFPAAPAAQPVPS